MIQALSHLACCLVLVVAVSAHAKDAPEISRSAGVRGGVVVFWPRIIPRSETVSSRDMASAIQRRLVTLVDHELGDRMVDIRPEPERVCPKKGCQAMTAGALLIRKKSSCVVIGLFSRWGKAPSMLVPWVGEVKLKTNVVPFREPPESQVTVVDWVPCDEVEAQLGTAKEALVKALRAAASG